MAGRSISWGIDMAIDRLSGIDAITGGDQLAMYSAAQGGDRKIPFSVVQDALRADLPLPASILDISSYFTMRITTPVAVAVGTTYANIPNYNSNFALPSDRTGIAASLVVGEFICSRDVAAVQFFVALNGTWPTNRDLSLAVYVGTDASPFESAFQFIGAGRGGGAPVTATFSGPTSNVNNPGGIIKAGEKIRLVAKFNTADTLNITRLSFVTQTLDGV